MKHICTLSLNGTVNNGKDGQLSVYLPLFENTRARRYDNGSHEKALHSRSFAYICISQPGCQEKGRHIRGLSSHIVLNCLLF